jgi:hypothetical protein
MKTPTRFYVDGIRKDSKPADLDKMEAHWRKNGIETDCLNRIGEAFRFPMNNALWIHRTDHSLTIVNTEGVVMYWKTTLAAAR